MAKSSDQTQISHCLLNQVKLYNRIIGGYLEYEVGNLSADELALWQNSLRYYRPLDDDTLFLPQDYWKAGDIKLTGKLKVLMELSKIKFPQYLFLLDHEKNNRIKMKNLHFHQQQLWYILFSLVKTSYIMEKKGYRLGDICCGTILLNQFGRIKIFNSLSVPKCKDYISRKLLRRAPEELEAQGSPTLINSLDWVKCQAYSIGMTMLEISLLCSMDGAYKGKIVQEDVNRALMEVARLYSPFYTQILLQMLIQNVDQRASSCQIYWILKPYEDQINEIEKFEADAETCRKSLLDYYQLKQ